MKTKNIPNNQIFVMYTYNPLDHFMCWYTKNIESCWPLQAIGRLRADLDGAMGVMCGSPSGFSRDLFFGGRKC